MAKANKNKAKKKDENSIPFLVKLSILEASGKGGDPDDLDEDTDLSDVLIQPEHFLLLRSFLLAIIKKNKPSATININQIKSCSVVEEVIDLVIQIAA